MNITIRPENEKDYFETEYITREAFWDVYHPGCTEHLVLHQLRKAPAFVRELDFVACDGKRIVGNVVCSKAKVVNTELRESEVLCMGPLAVLPDYQGKGIGGLLINTVISKARELGYKGIVIFGNPYAQIIKFIGKFSRELRQNILLHVRAVFAFIGQRRTD